MAKMTTQAKLDQARLMVAKYEAQLAAEAIKNNIEAGDEVTFNYGRGDSKKELSGTVLGIKDDANGRWVAISAGEGFDMQRYTVRTADITSNPTADKRAPGGEAVLSVRQQREAAVKAEDAKGTKGKAPVDPLEAE